MQQCLCKINFCPLQPSVLAIVFLIKQPSPVIALPLRFFDSVTDGNICREVTMSKLPNSALATSSHVLPPPRCIASSPTRIKVLHLTISHHPQNTVTSLINSNAPLSSPSHGCYQHLRADAKTLDISAFYPCLSRSEWKRVRVLREPVLAQKDSGGCLTTTDGRS